MRKAKDAEAIDLVILDLMMPGEDELTLTRYLRESSNVSIIILTRKDEEVDRSFGMEMGAVDHVAKPSNSRELLAQVKTVLRRSKNNTDMRLNAGNVSEFAGWTLDKIGWRLTSPHDGEVSLTTMEFKLLISFTENANKVLDRDRLLDVLRNRRWEPYDRSIDVLVGRLRNKIEAHPKKPDLIKTVRGTEYVFTTRVEYS